MWHARSVCDELTGDLAAQDAREQGRGEHAMHDLPAKTRVLGVVCSWYGGEFRSFALEPISVRRKTSVEVNWVVIFR